MKRLGTLVVAALFAVACGSSSKSNGNGNSGGSSGNGGSSTSGGSGNGGSSASGGSGNSGNGGSGNAGNGGSGNSGNGGSGNSGNGGSGNSGNGGSGNSGNGGSGTGGAGGAMAGPQCTTASDCTLHSDCCNCIALAPGEQAPACNKTCAVDACAALGIKQTNVACTAGACNAGIDCDPSTVTCLTPTPNCPVGQVPSVRGQCWGPCVQSTECATVPDCSVCDSTTSVCVVNDSKPNTTHCVQVPPMCNTQRLCGCLANAVCLDPYNLCAHVGGSLEFDCTCTTC